MSDCVVTHKLSPAGSKHMRNPPTLDTSLQRLLERLVRDEEGRRSGRASSANRADTAIDSPETSRGQEAAGRLDPRLDRVEGEEHEVDG